MTELDKRLLNDQVNVALTNLSRLFSADMRCTLVVRHPTNDECYFVFTVDDLAEVAALVARSAAKEKK